MSSFSFPDRPASEIIAVLGQTGISALTAEDLAAPSADLVSALYANFLDYVDPLGDDPDGQIGFEALGSLENPDQHADSIRLLHLYVRVRGLLASIRFPGFSFRDLLRPDPRRTALILSTIVNFIYYREDKLNMLQPVADQFPNYEERQMELETKISELNKEILDHEVASKMEEPIVQEVDAEVKQLRQTIQNHNKQQMSLKAVSKGFKDKSDVIKEKISQTDFELNKVAQENSKLLSKIVQSPDKLQRALEEKKLTRAEVKNSERLAMQSVKEKTTTFELYSKVYEKMAKNFSQMQAIQEQVHSEKTIDKGLKAFKAKLSDEGVSHMSLEAKLVEWQEKANEIEKLIKATEQERNINHADDAHKLVNLRREMEWKLQSLDPRERKAEDMVAKGESLCFEADSVKAAGRVKENQLHAKLEEIVHVFHNYSSPISSSLQRIESL